MTSGVLVSTRTLNTERISQHLQSSQSMLPLATSKLTCSCRLETFFLSQSIELQDLINTYLTYMSEPSFLWKSYCGRKGASTEALVCYALFRYSWKELSISGAINAGSGCTYTYTKKDFSPKSNFIHLVWRSILVLSIYFSRNHTRKKKIQTNKTKEQKDPMLLQG